MVEDLPDLLARELMLAEALSHVPGYRPGDPAIETARLAGGSVNRSYSVMTPVGRFVMRLSNGTDAWLASDRSVERELHGIAAAADLAPPIVHADGRDRWLITEYAVGRLWTEADFANPSQLARLAETLRRLHSLPPPDTGRFDLLGALSGYGQRIRPHLVALERETEGPSGLHPPHLGLDAMARYLEAAPEAWRVCGAADRPQAILHHDLNASNIIETARELVLIDWECAAVSDPLLDVACILSYYPASRRHSELLLQHAGLEAITRRQLAAAIWLFDLHTCLWYRERRLRLLPSDTELAVEQRLTARLPAGLLRWSKVPLNAGNP
jgi:aminoglycoside phosphotransferase (APT) family kinase protein